MMTGVAKRMAGQFFSAIDAELSGAVVPIGSVPSAAAGQAPADQPAVASPQVFTGRPAATAVAPADVRSLLVGAAGGSLLTLLGVAVGYLMGRHRS
jgi:hypothetical protein